MLSDVLQIRQQDLFSRLSAADVAVLGRFLFGNRWQKLLSERLGVSRQIVVAWAGSKRPVSRKYSSRIAGIVGSQHDRRRTRERATYLAMIQSLSSESARTLMLEMLAAEIEVRVQAVSVLARNGRSTSGSVSPQPARQQQK